MPGTAYIHYGSAGDPPMQTCLVSARRVKPGKPWQGRKPSVFQIQRFPGAHWQNVYERHDWRQTYAMVDGKERNVSLHGTEID